MEISFKGINNVRFAKNRGIVYKRGLFPDRHGEIKMGQRRVDDYKIRMNLTNDTSGNHYDELLNAMSSAEQELNTSVFKNSDTIELQLTKNMDVDENFNPTGYSFSTFKINGEDIAPSGRKILRLYTFLAKLTREIKQSLPLSKEQQQLTDTFNKAIQTEAVRIIDMI